MSFLGVRDLTYGQSKMTRYENKHTKEQCSDTIYVYNKKITSAFRMESKYNYMLACAWSESFVIASWYVLS